MEETYHEKLKRKIKEFAHLSYRVSRLLPKEELFGLTSQLRRSAMSVLLNYVEGYAKQTDNSNKHFMRTSYASLKETECILEFCLEEEMLEDNNEYQCLLKLADQIGGMLWKLIN